MNNIKVQPSQEREVQGGPGESQGSPGEEPGVQQDGGYPQSEVFHPQGGVFHPQGEGYPQDAGLQQTLADLLQRIMNAEKRIQDCCDSIQRNEGALVDKVIFTHADCVSVYELKGIVS